MQLEEDVDEESVEQAPIGANNKRQKQVTRRYLSFCWVQSMHECMLHIKCWQVALLATKLGQRCVHCHVQTDRFVTDVCEAIAYTLSCCSFIQLVKFVDAEMYM